MLTRIASLCRNLVRRGAVERELDAELQAHVDLLTDEYVRSGMPAAEARRRALLETGGLEQVKEEVRAARAGSFVESVAQDVRYASRWLVRSPVWTAGAVLTLALGIGATTAVFGLVHRLLLHPLPYHEPDRLVGITIPGMPTGTFVALRERLTSMELAAAGRVTGMNLRSRDDEAIRIEGSEVSGELMPLLGARAIVGRTMGPHDARPGQDGVVVLSHGFWTRRFGADPGVIGSVLLVDEVPRQVIGVMPAHFEVPSPAAQIWVPMKVDPANHWGAFRYAAAGRLRPGRSLADARGELEAAMPHVMKAFPYPMPQDWGVGAEVVPLRDVLVGDEDRRKLLVSFAATGLLLFIACANVAHLLLARSAGRQREITVRAALGATRARLVRQLLTESLLLASLGALGGLAVARAATSVFGAMLPADTPGLTQVGPDWPVLVFAVAVATLTAIAFGAAPALATARDDHVGLLRTAAHHGSDGRKARRIATRLVVAEIALSTVLVACAVLLVRTFAELTRLDTGFRAEQVVTARLTPSAVTCRDREHCAPFYDEVVRRIRAHPATGSAALASSLPFRDSGNSAVAVEDHSRFTPDDPKQVWVSAVSPGYLKTMGIPLREGRDFTDHDGPGREGVVLVSEVLARRFWPGESSIGKRVKPSWMEEWRTVVGVVGDVRNHGLAPGPWALENEGTVYFPHRQGIIAPPLQLSVVVRTERPGVIASELPAIIRSVDPSVPLTELVTMERVVADSHAATRTRVEVFGALAAMAVVLAAVGIYAVLAWSVRERTAEIGIRMALGASRDQVVAMVLGRGVRLVGAGTVLGFAGAWMAARGISTMLFGVEPGDPLTYAAVGVIVIAVSTTAIAVPARAASRTEPMSALRCE